MSITFAPQGMTSVVVPCPPTCGDEDHRDDGFHDLIEVGINVSNSNAVALFAALRIGAEPDGTISADDLRERCLLALALDEGDHLGCPPDPGTAALMEAIGVGHPSGPQIIDCGRREGYIAERLSQLLAVAEQAASLGVEVVWS